jgi:hypothetical protein
LITLGVGKWFLNLIGLLPLVTRLVTALTARLTAFIAARTAVVASTAAMAGGFGMLGLMVSRVLLPLALLTTAIYAYNKLKGEGLSAPAGEATTPGGEYTGPGTKAYMEAHPGSKQARQWYREGRGGGDGRTVVHTNVQIDGETVGRAIHRVAKRKKSEGW